MKHSKTFLALTLTALLALSLTACGQDGKDSSAEGGKPGSAVETPVPPSAEDKDLPLDGGDASTGDTSAGDDSTGDVTLTPDSGSGTQSSVPQGGGSTGGSIQGGGSTGGSIQGSISMGGAPTGGAAPAQGNLNMSQSIG